VAVVGQGGVGIDEDGDEGMAAMGESCNSSPSSHSSLSNSASHLRLAACPFGGGEVTAGVGSVCSSYSGAGGAGGGGGAGVVGRELWYASSAARVVVMASLVSAAGIGVISSATAATSFPYSRRTARGKSRRKSSVEQNLVSSCSMAYGDSGYKPDAHAAIV
jgi:hypothetical protein